MIWTELTLEGTRYHSGPYTPHELLNAEEDKEFKKWVELFKQTHPIGSKHYFQIITEKLKLEASTLRSDPKEVLDKLRKYMEESILNDPDQRIIDDPTLGYISLSNFNAINKLSTEQMNILCRNPQIQQHLPFLLRNNNLLLFKHYFAFMKIKGAKEEFEKQCLALNINLERFSDDQIAALTQEVGLARFTMLKTRAAFSRFSQSIQRILPSPAQVGILAVGLAGLGSYWALRSTSLNQ